MAHALAHSDVIYVMKQGEVVERIEKKNDKFIPGSEYAKKLISASLWDVAPKTIISS